MMVRLPTVILGILLVILGFLIVAYEIENFTLTMLIGFVILVVGVWILATRFSRWTYRH